MQAKDILGALINPGDRIAYADGKELTVARIDEVRYVAPMDGRNRAVDQAFATRFNLRVTPIVSSISFPCRAADGAWEHSKDTRGTSLTPEKKTINVDKVDRLIKL